MLSTEARFPLFKAGRLWGGHTEGASGPGNPEARCQRRSFLVGQFGNDKKTIARIALGRIE